MPLPAICIPAKGESLVISGCLRGTYVWLPSLGPGFLLFRIALEGPYVWLPSLRPNIYYFLITLEEPFLWLPSLRLDLCCLSSFTLTRDYMPQKGERRLPFSKLLLL